VEGINAESEKWVAQGGRDRRRGNI